MWYFPHPETAIPLEEPADPRGSRSYRRIVDSGWEKCHIFWKKTQILFEFDSFFGVESGPFFAEKSAKFFRSFDFSSRTRKYFADFSAKENCHFRPQKTSRIWREIGIFLRKCGFFLIRRLRFSLWSGYLGDQPARIEELQSADETNATFSHKNPSFSSNSTRFLGSKVAIFPYFWALLPEPETTSLVFRKTCVQHGQNILAKSYGRGLVYCGCREGQIRAFFQKSGRLIWKIRAPLWCKRNGNLVIGKSKDCNSSKENNVVSACVTP